MRKNPRLSIIIVKYKVEKQLGECVKSLKTKIPHEVIVVDNDKHNVGYGAGINLGAKKAKGDLLFILNPDTKLEAGVIEKLVSFYLDNPKCGVVAPDLMDEDGNLYDSIGTGKLTPISAIFSISIIHRLFPGNPIAKKYWIDRDLKKKVREVEVAPGAAFLVNKKLFEKVGGFDEKFFLYFEESDFCRRIRELGFKIYILQNAKITHTWGASTKSNPKKDFYFKQSRRYYFEKYYGKLVSNIVEFVLNFDKWDSLFLLVFILAFFLRFFRFGQNLRFDGEIGDNYLDIKNIIGGFRTPFLGPPTSHPWLYFGPLYYWIAIPVMLIFRFDPIGPAYLILMVSMITLFANYYFVSKLFGKKAALISSFLVGISPLWIALSRGSRFFSLVTLLFYPFFYLLIKSLEEKKERFFLVGLILGMMLNFHLTPIVLIPAVVILDFVKRRRYLVRDMVKMFFGILIPTLPFLFYNLTHGMKMVKDFALWIPYRVLGFVGLYPKNTASGHVISQNFVSLYKFITSSFFPSDNVVGLIVFLAIIVATIVFLFNYRRNLRLASLGLIFLCGYIGVFIHGDPPPHYYLPLYFIPILIFTFVLMFLLKTTIGKIAVSLVLFTFILFDFKYYFSSNWFFTPTDRVVLDAVVPYNLQVQVSKQIISDAKGAKFNLKRVGVNDQFSQNYSQNYRYLMWLGGNEPQDTKQNLGYIIIEQPPNIFIERFRQ